MTAGSRWPGPGSILVVIALVVVAGTTAFLHRSGMLTRFAGKHKKPVSTAVAAGAGVKQATGSAAAAKGGRHGHGKGAAVAVNTNTIQAAANVVVNLQLNNNSSNAAPAAASHTHVVPAEKGRAAFAALASKFGTASPAAGVLVKRPAASAASFRTKDAPDAAASTVPPSAAGPSAFTSGAAAVMTALAEGKATKAAPSDATPASGADQGTPAPPAAAAPTPLPTAAEDDAAEAAAIGHGLLFPSSQAVLALPAARPETGLTVTGCGMHGFQVTGSKLWKHKAPAAAASTPLKPISKAAASSVAGDDSDASGSSSDDDGAAGDVAGSARLLHANWAALHGKGANAGTATAHAGRAARRGLALVNLRNRKAKPVSATAVATVPAADDASTAEPEATMRQTLDTPSPPAAAPTPSAGTDGAAIKSPALDVDVYRRMLKVGVPRPAVERKMAQDGVDSTLLDAAEPLAAPTAHAAAGATADASLAVDLSSLPEDLLRYARMTRVGVPVPAVMVKIRSEGAVYTEAEVQQAAEALNGAGRTSSGGSAASPALPTTPARSQAPSVTVQPPPGASPLPLLPPHNVMKKTESKSSMVLPPLPTLPPLPGATDSTARELTALFSSAASSSAGGVRTAGASPTSSPAAGAAGVVRKPARVSLLDAKRATNAGIALAKFRSVPYPAVALALMQLTPTVTITHPTTGKTETCMLTAAQLSLLADLVPSPSEAAMVNTWAGKQGNDRACLGEMESFILALSEAGVDRVAERVAALSFRAGLQSKAADLTSRIDAMASAVTQMQGCAKLQTVLASARSLAPHAGEDATTFNIMSLGKLSTTRLPGAGHKDPRGTLLHYLAAMLDRSDKDAAAMSVNKDLPAVAVAARAECNGIAAEVASLRAGLRSYSAILGVPSSASSSAAMIDQSLLGDHTAAAASLLPSMASTVDDLAARLASTTAAFTGMLAGYGCKPGPGVSAETVFAAVIDFCAALGKARGDMAAAGR